jgi:hypothetical protein
MSTLTFKIVHTQKMNFVTEAHLKFFFSEEKEKDKDKNSKQKSKNSSTENNM